MNIFEVIGIATWMMITVFIVIGLSDDEEDFR